jgi:hypothetical protein
LGSRFDNFLRFGTPQISVLCHVNTFFAPDVFIACTHERTKLSQLEFFSLAYLTVFYSSTGIGAKQVLLNLLGLKNNFTRLHLIVDPFNQKLGLRFFGTIYLIKRINSF